MGNSSGVRIIAALKRESAPVKFQVAARLDKETKDWLEKFCETEGVSASALVAALIKDFKKGQQP